MVSEARVLIAPSVLSADFADLGRQVRAVTDAGADLIHVDVMDGIFVSAISFGEVVVDAIRANTDVPLNIHLMIQEPENLLATFAKVESDQILVHAEACGHLHRTVSRIKDKGNQVGVAINPGTSISAVEDVLPLLDMVMVMSVNPGFSDQERASFDNILAAGFTDTFRHFYPDTEAAYSWWSYRAGARGNNVGWRLDYFCTSAALTPRLESASILSDVLGSDHCPVTLTLR